jgi:hypothetical protein
VLYLTTPSTPLVREVMRAGSIGAMLDIGNRKSCATLDRITHAIDNGCFADTWDESRWLRALERWQPIQGECLFAVVPDVVADAAATRERWDRYSGSVRALGYRTAYVGQDGLNLDAVPWDEFDAWFTGGSTEWKLSDEAFDAASEARARGKWTHMGRVNSARRLHAAWSAGYDSADGTFIAFGPDVNLPRVLSWLDRPPLQFSGRALSATTDKDSCDGG